MPEDIWGNEAIVALKPSQSSQYFNLTDVLVCPRLLKETT